MLTGLNITSARTQIAQKMISNTESLVGYQVRDYLGPVHAVVERSYSRAAIGGIGAVTGGGLSEMIFDAKQEIAMAAADVGANAIVGFRFSLCGRELEKSLIAYGTAVYAEKKS